MMTTPPVMTTKTGAEALNLLDDPQARVWLRRPAFWLIVVLMTVLLAAWFFWSKNQANQAAPMFVTTPLARGNLTLSVMANGTLQPTRSVSIGSELSGTVSRVLVDVNDKVKKGQVLVELDTAKLNDQIVRSRAALDAARAALAQANATVKESQANFDRLQEVARLSGGKVPSKAELDTAAATLDRAKATVLSAEANVLSAKASLSTDETNLARASIRSPIDGVILTRSVDPGNAVAASLQAVTLFTIAEDLTHLRLQVNVDEADVGAVQLGQKSSFTVSAYANRQYPATITRVAYGSTITDNVVTYITYLDVDNSDLSLRPGMTASATITAKERNDVLIVPNTALRFTPSHGGTAAAPGKSGLMTSLMPRPPGQAARKSATESANGKKVQQIWILRDNAPVAIAVTRGISDGKMTEVSAPELQAGMQVITEQRQIAAK